MVWSGNYDNGHNDKVIMSKLKNIDIATFAEFRLVHDDDTSMHVILPLIDARFGARNKHVLQ